MVGPRPAAGYRRAMNFLSHSDYFRLAGALRPKPIPGDSRMRYAFL